MVVGSDSSAGRCEPSDGSPREKDGTSRRIPGLDRFPDERRSASEVAGGRRRDGKRPQGVLAVTSVQLHTDSGRVASVTPGLERDALLLKWSAQLVLAHDRAHARSQEHRNREELFGGEGKHNIAQPFE